MHVKTVSQIANFVNITIQEPSPSLDRPIKGEGVISRSHAYTSSCGGCANLWFTTLAWGTGESIERQIELEDVDALLAENAEKPVLGHVGDQGLYLGLWEVARLCHSRHLELGGGRRDVGV